MIDKEKLVQCIITQLEEDIELALSAAKKAHDAAIDDETQPDNKYDTTSLEASYIAQGHANRAQDLKKSLDCYKNLALQHFSDVDPLYLTALVEIEYEDGLIRQLFIGPEAGGLKVVCEGQEVMVVTPRAPLCVLLMGKQLGDIVSAGRGIDKEFVIISAC